MLCDFDVFHRNWAFMLRQLSELSVIVLTLIHLTTWRAFSDQSISHPTHRVFNHHRVRRILYAIDWVSSIVQSHASLYRDDFLFGKLCLVVRGLLLLSLVQALRITWIFILFDYTLNHASPSRIEVILAWSSVVILQHWQNSRILCISIYGFRELLWSGFVHWAIATFGIVWAVDAHATSAARTFRVSSAITIGLSLFRWTARRFYHL